METDEQNQHRQLYQDCDSVYALIKKEVITPREFQVWVKSILTGQIDSIKESIKRGELTITNKKELLYVGNGLEN